MAKYDFEREIRLSTATSTEAPQPIRHLRVTFGALMLVMLLASLDQTIVSTALPVIVGEFGGLAHLSWIVTAYMLATTIVTPLYGKLGDLFGRKIVLQSAIVLFLIGSALCGLAQSMGQLIVFRAVQGMGGGGLMVTTMAAIGDIIPPRERGRYQGYFGGVFGLSTVLGPLIGGFFVEHLSWRWIFYINLPLGMLAVGVIGWAFSAPASRKRPKIDVAGAGALAVMLTSLVLFTSMGGHTFGWGSPQIVSLTALTIAALIAFIFIEHRAAEPILPLGLFTNRTFLISCSVGFIVGLAMFGSVTYMPVYLQTVRGISPSAAGLQLTPMMGGVLLTSITSGQIISRVGRYRLFPIAGTAIMAIGLGLLSRLGVSSSAWAAPVYMLVLGLGLGMVMQVLVLAVQNAVDYRYLGVATSGTTLFRSTGGSVGVALFGAIFASGLTSQLAARFPGGPPPGANDPAAITALPAAAHAAYLDAFVAALQPVYITAAFIGVAAFVMSWFLKEIPLKEARAETIGESFAVPRDTSSIDELRTILDRLSSQENRWDTIARIAARDGVTLPPDETWILIQISRLPKPVGVSQIAVRLSVAPAHFEGAIEQLMAKGFLESGPEGIFLAHAGRALVERMITGYRARSMEQLKKWSPEHHAEVRTMVSNFIRDLLDTPPRQMRSPRHEV